MTLSSKLLVLALSVATVIAPVVTGAGDASYRIVANSSVEVDALSREELSRLFLKKVTRWADGRAVLPIIEEGPAAKDAFSEQILGKSPGALRSYWAQMVFSGRDVPPLERKSAEEVVKYVRSTPGAIGVISAGPVPTGVRLVTIK